MKRRVLTSFAASSLTLTAMVAVWLGDATQEHPGKAGFGGGHVLTTIEEPVPCSPSEDVTGTCDSGNADSGDADGGDAATAGDETAAQPSSRPSPGDDTDPSRMPSPPASPAPPGDDDNDDRARSGKTTQLQYEHGIDRKSWYWDRQRDQEVAAGPVAQRARLPSPQRPDTLPVAVESGQPSKQSAIRFDLVGHDIPAGSKVTRFVLTVAEGTDPGEAPTVNPQDRKVQACPAGGFWPSGEAETWNTRPDVTDECVTGSRRGGDAEASWIFDLSAMAASWGKDPFRNNGIILTGTGAENEGTAETWQVNLKAPLRDDPVTPMNEYEETSDRVVAEVGYVPGRGPAPSMSALGGPGMPGTSGTADGPGLSTGTLSGDSAIAGAPGAAGSGDVRGPELPTVAARPRFVPRVPPYVWALIPAALLGTAAVRAALMESTAATRPGGVIETIRGRNAAQRGTPPSEAEGLVARLLTLLPFGEGGR